MTDAELTRLCAERVMGWEVPSLQADTHWPLEDDHDACAVLDRMVELGWDYTLTQKQVPVGAMPCRCEFDRPMYFMPQTVEVEASTRPRAIVLAALKAVGVEVAA